MNTLEHFKEFSEEDIQRIADKIISEGNAKRLKLSEFMKTPIFHKIIREIIKNNIFLDEESFRYFPEKTLAEFGIEGLSEEDLNSFISCMTDDQLIIPQNSFVEEENYFENTTSEKLGLKVFMMWGQGCCIQIFPAYINRRGE